MTNNTILIRYIQVFLFVAIYITLGLVFKLGPNTYQFIGVPLIIAFQLFIRKQPIQTLWVRDGSAFKLNKWGMMIGTAFIIFPVKVIINMILHNKVDASTTLFMVATITGTLGLAYSISHFTKSTLRFLLLCLATAGVLGAMTVGFSGSLRAVFSAPDSYRDFVVRCYTHSDRHSSPYPLKRGT